MADLLVTQELRSYLIANGIGVDPNVTPTTNSVSIWTQPRKGAPLPRNLAKDVDNRWAGETTVTIMDPLNQPPSVMEEWVEDAHVNIIVRSPSSEAAQLTMRAIRTLLIPYSSLGGHWQFTMGALLVERCREGVMADQELPELRSIAASDKHATYDRICSYVFSARRKLLAGLTMP